MSEQAISILTFIVLVGYVAFDKIILPKMNSSTVQAATDTVTTAVDLAQKINIICQMANKFVVLAKAEMKDASGEEKRNWVIEKLKGICESLDVVLGDDELRAINEGAYEDKIKNVPATTATTSTTQE